MSIPTTYSFGFGMPNTPLLDRLNYDVALKTQVDRADRCSRCSCYPRQARPAVSSIASSNRSALTTSGNGNAEVVKAEIPFIEQLDLRQRRTPARGNSADLQSCRCVHAPADDNGRRPRAPLSTRRFCRSLQARIEAG